MLPTRIFEKIKQPQEGETITVVDSHLKVPNEPIIPIITGDGTGPDITRAAKRVLDAAVEKAYNGKRKIVLVPCPCRRRIPQGIRRLAARGHNQGNRELHCRH